MELQTVSQFMATLYTEISDENTILEQLGIKGLTPAQLAYLNDLPLKSSVSCLLMFTNWVEEGLYDFCTLPFSLKVHISDEDKVVVEQEVMKTWKGSTRDLLVEICELMDVLKHSENNMCDKVNESPDVSCMLYIIELWNSLAFDLNICLVPRIQLRTM